LTTNDAKPISKDEFHALFARLKNWGRWGEDDQRGALNLITPENRRRAAALVREGLTVSCALPLNTQGGADNPRPVVRTMTSAGDLANATGSGDYFAISPHGMAHTHLDALCHIFYRGQMFNGRPQNLVTSTGALANSIEAGRDGIVSRGVLLDIPHSLGREWLDPAEAIYAEDLEAAEKAEGVRVEPGDIVFIRTGRHRRREKTGSGSLRDGLAGVHASALPWVHERGVAILGSDGISDVMPSGLEGGGLPVHNIIIPAMGVHLVDNAQLDDLSDACALINRWEFMLTLAPLRLVGGTASPVNPIALM